MIKRQILKVSCLEYSFDYFAIFLCVALDRSREKHLPEQWVFNSSPAATQTGISPTELRNLMSSPEVFLFFKSLQALRD